MLFYKVIYREHLNCNSLEQKKILCFPVISVVVGNIHQRLYCDSYIIEQLDDEMVQIK